MKTVWDWVMLLIFGGLATLLLQRSIEEEPRDKLWQYAPPALGCMEANYLGNNGESILAAAAMAATAIYIFIVLKVRLPGT